MGAAYGNSREIVPVTIPNGTALSSEAVVGARTVVGIIMPAAWTAADLSVQVLVDETGTTGVSPTRTYAEAVDTGGTNLAVTGPAAGEYVVLPVTAWAGLGRIRIRSGTAGAPVNQAADRTLRLVCI